MYCRHLVSQHLLERVARTCGKGSINGRFQYTGIVGQLKPMSCGTHGDHVRIFEGIDEMKTGIVKRNDLLSGTFDKTLIGDLEKPFRFCLGLLGVHPVENPVDRGPAALRLAITELVSTLVGLNGE